MTILQQLKNAFKGKSKYKQHHLIRDGVHRPGQNSRQRIRHAAMAQEFQNATARNPGMPRKDRRMLGRAYGAKIAREAMAAKRPAPVKEVAA